MHILRTSICETNQSSGELAQKASSIGTLPAVVSLNASGSPRSAGYELTRLTPISQEVTQAPDITQVHMPPPSGRQEIGSRETCQVQPLPPIRPHI